MTYLFTGGSFVAINTDAGTDITLILGKVILALPIVITHRVIVARVRCVTIAAQVHFSAVTPETAW